MNTYSDKNFPIIPAAKRPLAQQQPIWPNGNPMNIAMDCWPEPKKPEPTAINGIGRIIANVVGFAIIGFIVLLCATPFIMVWPVLVPIALLVVGFVWMLSSYEKVEENKYRRIIREELQRSGRR